MLLHIVLCYEREDKRMVTKFKQHLSALKNNGLISLWDHNSILPGSVLTEEARLHFEQAEIILLLISAAFLGSQYYYSDEIQEAIRLHEEKKRRVIPIILRPSHWQFPPLDKLQPLPEGGKPVAKWTTQDDGFENATKGLLKVAELWKSQALPGPAEKREAFMEDFATLIEHVQTHLQPEPRARATAATLQQLSILVPAEVTLADVACGWRLLSQPVPGESDPVIVQRRVTCGQLADLAARVQTQVGSIDRAIQTWESWLKARVFHSPDPRHMAMIQTFTRELHELQQAT